MDDQRKDYINPKGPKRNHLKQLQTHNLPTDDVENIYSTNQGSDLLLANKKGCCKGSRSTIELLYLD